MSALGDAFSALKRIIIIDENMSRMQSDVALLAEEMRRVREYAGTIDKRVVRIETMIEMGRRSSQPRQIKD